MDVVVGILTFVFPFHFSFSGLANTFVLKALQRVSLKSKQATPPEVIEEIVESCNGDLRSALNMMQWITTSTVP